LKTILLTAVGVCAATIGLAEAPNSVSPTASRPQKNLSVQSHVCRLGADCLGISEIPVTACLVVGKDAKANGPCAFDGMKLISKFTEEPTFLL
jgi:hypothetical protein